MVEKPAAGSRGRKGNKGAAAADPWGAVRQEFGMYTISELADRLDFGGQDNLRANLLTGKARVLAVQDKGTFLYPGFQFDEVRTRILPSVKDIIRLGRLNGWLDEELLRWFSRPNPLLSGKRPVDVLQNEELLLPAAEKDLCR